MMAEAKISVFHDQFHCSVCLELLRDPVTTACGHNYCKQCIENCWDSTGIYNCPQCRMVFVFKPVLQRNTMLAEVVEELNKFNHSSGLRKHFISPTDVLCDVCIGTKTRAMQTCLTCLASFCETHIQPHRVSEALRKHKLVNPFADLKRKLCLRHQKAVEIYCRTDQTCICYLCAATEHKSHDTVTPDVERTERQAQLLTSFNDSKEKIQSKEKTLTKVTVTISQLKSSADKEIQEYEKTFTSLLRSIESLRSQVTEVVRDHEQREVKRAEELKKRLEKEIEELKRRNTELVELSQTDDDIHFLQKFPSVQACSESEDTANTAINVHFFLEDLRENLSNLQKCLKEVSCWKFVNISKSETSAPEVKRMRKVEEEAHSSGVPTWDWFSKKSSPVVGKDKVTIEVVGLEKTFHSGRRFFEDLIKKMNDSRIDIHQGVFDSQSSNLALLFCPIVSRIGTDIKVALKKIPNNKKVILVVMHHTLNPGHIVAESARFVEQKNVVGTVDLLFHENLGLLECQLNKQSLEKVFFFCKDHCMK